MMNYWGYYGPAGSVIGLIFMVLFWVLIIAFVIWLIRRITGNDRDRYFYEKRNPSERDYRDSMELNKNRRMESYHENSHEKTPLDILKERYAKGEINKIEYEEKKKDLM